MWFIYTVHCYVPIEYNFYKVQSKIATISEIIGMNNFQKIRINILLHRRYFEPYPLYKNP
jgi:hypothetical protein